MRGVVVGCDKNQTWLLPWWYENYRKYNAYPVHFVDFDTLPYVSNVYFKKPLAILSAPFEEVLWIDLDCLIRGSLDPIFHSLVLGEVAIVPEIPVILEKSRKDGMLLADEMDYNTGVVALRKSGKFLRDWIRTQEEGSFLNEQYAFDRTVYLHKPALVELPSIYNLPFEWTPQEAAVILHFIGVEGKLAILRRLEKEKFAMIPPHGKAKDSNYSNAQ